MIKKDNMPICNVATTVQIVGSKWKLLILRDLLTGPKRPSQLLQSLEGLSQKVLTSCLKSMMEDKIVERIDFEVVPLHVEYKLTSLGNTLLPIIDVMEQWGKYYKQQL